MHRYSTSALLSTCNLPPHLPQVMAQRFRTVTISEEEEEFRRALDSVPPPTPPDGGWGWLVVFSSFMINAIVDGFCHSYGILMPELIRYFNSSARFDDDLVSDSYRRSETAKVEEEMAYLQFPTATMSLGGALLLGIYMLTGR